MNITGNTILITGGTSGIGRALAERLHAKGNVVIIAGRRQNLLDEITAKHPGMHGLQMDMQSAADIDKAAAKLRREFPKLNVLINNAGIMAMEDVTKDDGLNGPAHLATSRSIIETNITSVLHLTAALLPQLKKQPSSTVIATTSGLAFVPMAAFPTYCATKAFLHSWLQSLRAQLVRTSVEVLELPPPYVQTELTGEHQKADPHAMPLDAFADQVMSLLETKNTPNGEILVERVKALRFAERDGKHEQMRAMLDQLVH